MLSQALAKVMQSSHHKNSLDVVSDIENFISKVEAAVTNHKLTDKARQGVLNARASSHGLQAKNRPCMACVALHAAHYRSAGSAGTDVTGKGWAGVRVGKCTAGMLRDYCLWYGEGHSDVKAAHDFRDALKTQRPALTRGSFIETAEDKAWGKGTPLHTCNR
jgi:hypothetical protein